MPVVRKSTVAELETSKNFDALLQAYGEEVHAEGAPDPCARMPMYRDLEARGALTAFGAWYGDILIGIITVLKPILPHYSVLIPVIESWYVLKDYRSTGAGEELLNLARDMSIELGAIIMIINSPTGGVLEQVLTKKKNCKEVGKVFMMRLKDV